MSEPVSSAGAPRRAERAAAPSSPLRLADSSARVAASVVGRLLAARARAVAEGATVLGAAAARGCLDAARSAHPARKTILFYWIEDVLPMMVMDIRAREVLGGETEAFRFVCDDTFGGCVAESLLSRLGRRTLLLRRQRPAERIRDLQRIMRSIEPMGIAVDGHGPYGRVGEAFPRLVESAGAVALPVSVVADRSHRIWARASLLVPGRGATLAIAVGDPLPASAVGSGAEPFQAALDATRVACRAALAQRARIPGGAGSPR